MAQIIPYPHKTHILIVEDDWVIREVLTEHFRSKPACRLSIFNDLGQALYFLRLDCQAHLILSNINLDGTGEISLSASHLWHNECEVVITTGYCTEAERFQAFDAGRELYRVQPFRFDALCRLVRVGEQIRSYTHR
jgi:DNA-binding NtrC family response regulator